MWRHCYETSHNVPPEYENSVNIKCSMVLITINWLFLLSKYDNPLKYVSIFPVGRIPLPMVTNYMYSVMIGNINQYSFK